MVGKDNKKNREKSYVNNFAINDSFRRMNKSLSYKKSDKFCIKKQSNNSNIRKTIFKKNNDKESIVPKTFSKKELSEMIMKTFKKNIIKENQIS